MGQATSPLNYEGAAMTARVISIINLKGGVGKSTLTMMLGEFLAFRFSKNVLLIDMDAQANLSYCMVPPDNLDTQERAGRTIYHLFNAALHNQALDIRRYVTQPPLIVSNVARSAMLRHGTTLQMVVSTPTVAQLDEELLAIWESKQPMPTGVRDSLASALAPAIDEYDYVLMDCPPGLSLFSSAALVASQYFICPIIPEPLSLQGVKLVKKRAGELKESKAQFRGVIANIVKHYRRTHARISNDLYSTWSGEYLPFTNWLPDNERLRTLGEYDPDIQGQWAMGIDHKFPSLHEKYGLSYPLANPTTGPLSLFLQNLEPQRYRLEERIANLTEEFMGRCP
jgi:chromosome partitioning protein